VYPSVACTRRATIRAWVVQSAWAGTLRRDLGAGRAPFCAACRAVESKAEWGESTGSTADKSTHSFSHAIVCLLLSAVCCLFLWFSRSLEQSVCLRAMSQYSWRPNANDPNPYALRQSSNVSSSRATPMPTQAAAGSSTPRLHHPSVPHSVASWHDVDQMSTARIERALHARMEQYTGRDSDRFRQLLRWIKNRQSSAPAAQAAVDPLANPLLDASDAPPSVSTIRRDQFQNILEILGVFATPAQADALFDKYDAQGRGFLSLHELMSRAGSALESDFARGGHLTTSTVSDLASGSNEGPRSDDMFVNRGKRQFLRHKLTGEGERPITPRQPAQLISVPIVVRALREKMRINSKVGDTGSMPRARRVLARVFESFDPLELGSITQEQLVRALHSINFPLGEQHIRILMDAFPAATAPALLQGTQGRGGPPTASIYSIKRDERNRPLQDPARDGFDYVSFVLYVYPDTALTGDALSTSLFLNHQLGRDFFDGMTVEERRKRGLPPTHEQYEAMAAMARAEQEGLNEEEAKQQQQMNAPEVRSPQPLSQFARERAPPTPAPALSPETHYLNIAGRAPPPSWSRSIARNPYLQTVLSKGASTPGFPAQFAATAGGTASGGPGGAGSTTAQVLDLEVGAHTPAQHYASGSQSARGPAPPRDLPPPVLSPRGLHSSAGMRPSTGAQGQRKLHSSAGFNGNAGAASNALNPFNGGASFIPAANFPPHSQRPSSSSWAAVVNGSQSARGSGAPPSLSSFGPGVDAFANILAAPAPERRPQTGVSVFKRGGSNRPLPPVRARI